MPIREPATFSWPGPWLAPLPPACAWSRSARRPGSRGTRRPDERFEQVESGFLIAPTDVAQWQAESARPSPRTSGRIEALALAPDAEQPVALVDQATAVAGRGLEGDRYFDGVGTFSNVHARGHDLTLVEAEALAELGVTPEEARRNVVTRDIDLNALVGRRFTRRRRRVPRPAALRALRPPRAPRRPACSGGSCTEAACGPTSSAAA